MLTQEKKIGIIDLGSNSVRLVIFEIKPSGAFRLIDDLSDTIRLSEGMVEGKLISDAAMQRAVKTIKLFKKLCNSYGIPAENILAAATAAVRKAENRDQFLELLLKATGLSFWLLSGEEEAFYAYKAVIHTIDVDEGIIVDIGGGSTEIIKFKDKVLQNSVSIPVGAVVATEEFLGKDVIEPDILDKFEQYIQGMLLQLGWLSQGSSQVIIGLGGTIRNLAKIHRKKTDYPLDISHNYSIGMNEFYLIYSDISSLSLEERKKIEGMSPKRADIAVGGLAILKSIASLSRATQLVVSGHGLREGILLEYLLENPPAGSNKKIVFTDILDFSVDNLMELYSVRREHALHIANLSLSMFDQLKPLHKLDNNARRILRIAALLHDIGISISYYDHHKHSFYILLNSRMNGLTHREIVLSAAIAASHRKDRFRDDWEKVYKQLLLPGDTKLYRKLSLFLKVAECLDRSETGIVKSVECTLEKNAVKIRTFREDDAELELSQANEVSEGFQKVFNKTLVVL